jgi:hypothetical protein
MLDRLVSQNKTVSLFYLKLYCCFIALIVSLSFVFLFVLYFSDLVLLSQNKKYLIGNLTAAVLAVISFAILLHYYFLI